MVQHCLYYPFRCRNGFINVPPAVSWSATGYVRSQPEADGAGAPSCAPGGRPRSGERLLVRTRSALPNPSAPTPDACALRRRRSENREHAEPGARPHRAVLVKRGAGRRERVRPLCLPQVALAWQRGRALSSRGGPRISSLCALADVWLCPLGGTDHWQEDALHAVVPAALACLNIGVGRKAEAQCYSVYLPSSAARPCWRAMSLRERQPKRTMREASAMADLDAITTLQACSVANSCSLPPLRIRHGKARRRRGTRANRP